MDIPNFINICIGLILVYLTLSLLASEIQEMVSSFLELRARNLKHGIKKLLDKDQEESSITEKLYKNSLISALDHKTFFGQRPWKEPIGPSFIPADMFSAALLEVLNLDDESTPLEKNSQDIPTNIKNLRLPSKLERDLIQLSIRAKSHNTQFKDELEKWFNDSMDRMSGAYKRDAKVWAILIGFLLAFFSNADTFYIINRLSKEKAINSSLVTYVKEAEETCKQNNDKSASCIIDNEKLSELVLPIGWSRSSASQLQGIKNIFLKIIGWLVSGIAISMGSSFWFDLLGKFLNVRYAGRKPKARKIRNSS